MVDGKWKPSYISDICKHYNKEEATFKYPVGTFQGTFFANWTFFALPAST